MSEEIIINVFISILAFFGSAFAVAYGYLKYITSKKLNIKKNSYKSYAIKNLWIPILLHLAFCFGISLFLDKRDFVDYSNKINIVITLIIALCSFLMGYFSFIAFAQYDVRMNNEFNKNN